jgi:predicted CDP-diglyceride synthetase/phosphatidate cytidylyltransferase
MKQEILTREILLNRTDRKELIMARRYFNVFKQHLLVLIILVTFVCLSEFTNGTVSTIAKIGAGLLMIYSVISYAMWLLRTPGRVNDEES